MRKVFIVVLLCICQILSFAQKVELYRHVRQDMSSNMSWTSNPKVEMTRYSNVIKLYNNFWENVDSSNTFTSQSVYWMINWIPDSIFEGSWQFEMFLFNENDNIGRPDVKYKWDSKRKRSSREYYVFPADNALKTSKQRALHYSSIYSRVELQLIFEDNSTEDIVVIFCRNVNRGTSYNVFRKGQWTGWKAQPYYYHSNGKTPKLFISYQSAKASSAPIGLVGTSSYDGQREGTMIQWGLNDRERITFCEIPNKKCIGIKRIGVGGSSLARITVGSPTVNYKKANPIRQPKDGDFAPMAIRPIIYINK